MINLVKRYLNYSLIFLLLFYFSLLVFKEIYQKTIVIEAGPIGGFFHTSAEIIKNKLKEKNINAIVINREDTLKIIDDVNDPKSGVDIGFIAQDLNGIKYKNVNSLGSIILEPLFIFHKKDILAKSPADFKGLKVAVSPVNSGTRVISEQILEIFDVNELNTKFYPFTLSESANALKEGSIDTAFFLQPANNKIIIELGKNPKLKVMSLNQAEALTRKFNNLYYATIYAGGFDLKNNLPEKDVKVIAIPVTIVAKNNIPSSVITAISLILKEEFRNSNLVSETGTFPTMDYEKNIFINKKADEIFRIPFGSEPFLYRYLPFNIARVIDSIAVQLGYFVTLYFFCYYLGFPKIVELWQRQLLSNKLNLLYKIRDKSLSRKLTSDELGQLKKIDEYFSESTMINKSKAFDVIKKIKSKIKKKF
jgi:TRAP-type uncharacterized transport system substrate-binding protein